MGFRLPLRRRDEALRGPSPRQVDPGNRPVTSASLAATHGVSLKMADLSAGLRGGRAPRLAPSGGVPAPRLGSGNDLAFHSS